MTRLRAQPRGRALRRLATAPPRRPRPPAAPRPTASCAPPTPPRAPRPSGTPPLPPGRRAARRSASAPAQALTRLGAELVEPGDGWFDLLNVVQLRLRVDLEVVPGRLELVPVEGARDVLGRAEAAYAFAHGVVLGYNSVGALLVRAAQLLLGRLEDV